MKPTNARTIKYRCDNVEPGMIYSDEIGEKVVTALLESLPNKRAGRVLAKLTTALIFHGMLTFQGAEHFKMDGLPIPEWVENREYWTSGQAYYDRELWHTRSQIAWLITELNRKDHQLGDVQFSEN